MVLSAGLEVFTLFFVFSGLFLQTDISEGEEWYDRIESVIQARNWNLFSPIVSTVSLGI